jgi:hypothetical protein
VSNITLPREVVEKIREAWSSEVYPPAASIEWYDIMDALRAALDAALAEPRPAPSLEFFDGFRDGFRAAERHHGIAKEDK